MANILVLDTETTSIDKPFCYNVGYTIFNTQDNNLLEEKDFVIEQVWHNLPLFSSAYYADKRPIYVSAMRGRRATMNKWGYVMRELANDIKKHNVEAVLAYNNPFDDKTITYNCDWFKTINPLDEVPVLDIRGMVSEYITNTTEYKEFCEKHELFTEAGHYSGTAESVYKFITQNAAFEEAHTALADAKIEADIIKFCMMFDANPLKEYKVKSSIPRTTPKPIKIMIDDEVVYEGQYRKKFVRNGNYYFKTEL